MVLNEMKRLIKIQNARGGGHGEYGNGQNETKY